MATKPLSEMLRQWGSGERTGVEAILPEVYNELRRLARNQLRQQRANHTLQPTALVHEAYLRLADETSLAFSDRAHFVGIAAQLMRWILVDYERARQTAKRSSNGPLLTLNDEAAAVQAQTKGVDILSLHASLDRLAELDEQQSQIVELRYFGGLSIEDTAKFLDVSPATVKRSWGSARAWLLREMQSKEMRA